MHIALTSHSFAPSVGGIESASLSLAREFVRSGRQVTVVTQTPGPAIVDGIAVVRQPTRRQLSSVVSASDVLLQNNISLRTLWPALSRRIPVVVIVATWLRRPDGRVGLRDRLKQFALRRARVVAVSTAIADHLSVSCEVINNSYRADVFGPLDHVQVDREFVFVGRLVSDKGVDVLLRALAAVGASGIAPSLTIVGDGPERLSLGVLADELGLAAHVDFVGSVQGDDLNRLLNRHHTIVVPSTWHEPFGIVALEGIASGCVAVVSDGGGLPEAAGPCGLTFPNGDVESLTEQLKAAMDPAVRQDLRAHADAHLAAHSPQEEARRYLELLEKERERRV